ncbi:MAG: hypothetical protein HY782_10015 [Chloroflexi bacterium]|nr:hypothetical protein [Chloroflexota bacterium]
MKLEGNQALTWFLVFVVLLALLSACQSAPSTGGVTPPLPPSPTPAPSTGGVTPPLPPSPTRTPILASEGNYRVEIALFDSNARTAVTDAVGATVTLTIAFRPSKDVFTQTSTGTPTKYSTGWANHTVGEMRYCAGPGRTCTLPDRWVPFANEQRVSVPINWIGLRDFGVTAQFREASGKTIPAGLNLAESASNWLPITGVVDERTPAVAQPPAIQTIIAQARAAFPISGKIQVGEGRPMGGKAGSTITVTVQFEAASPLAPVTEMRLKRDSIGRCLTPDEMSDAAWEPFVAQKSYPVNVALNWTTFKLHVQYRDAKGHLSPVYCSDIAIEGGP